MRTLVPEVVQTSGMDCGPAALAALLDGCGVPVSYARLRDACATDVDGTSIDALEDVAVRLGLDAQQVMMPVDHLPLAESQALPAIVITRLPDGFTHFVVVWRRHGPLLQVMDPAVGRRWVPVRRFLAEVHRHDFAVPATAFEVWARSGDFRRQLGARLRHLGVPPATADEFVDEVTRTPGWSGIARLDAAIRAAEARSAEPGPKPGREPAARRLRRLLDGPDTALAEHRFAWPAPGDDSAVRIRGAVLVRVTGTATAPVDVAGLSPDLRAVLTERGPTPGRFLLDRLRGVGPRHLVGAALGALLAAGALLVEAAVLRSLLSGNSGSAIGGTLITMVALGLALLAIEAGVATLAAGMGRRLERDVRGRLLRHLPRLPDRYLRSRPLSDLAQRAHRLHRLRELPALAIEATRVAATAVLTPVAIALIDPPSALPALGIVLGCTAIAVTLLPAQAERDLRSRSHAGALARYYLDALLGPAPIRAHRAAGVLESGHQTLLTGWGRAVRAAHGAAGVAELAQAGLGLALTAWLLVGAAGRSHDPAVLLLLAYWAVGLPATCQHLGGLLRRYPLYRSVALRAIEPLATAGERVKVAAGGEGPAVGLRLDHVRVTAGGITVLDDIDLSIPAGQHVAVVGRAGSGKSTLVELLLGWHSPSEGRLLADGAPVSGAALRPRTAWVDPLVTLWNTSLAENLGYGAAPDSEVETMRSSLSIESGLDDPVGENGALLPRGEAQLVRLGRAMLRRDTRLVLLDEPFRGLDRRRRRTLLELARRRWVEQTMIVVTHDIRDTLDFSRVLVVEQGRIVADGAPRDLLHTDPHYARLLGEAAATEPMPVGVAE